MGLDLWFREDVARILASTQETMRTSLHSVAPLDPEMAGVYEQGFADALHAISIAFGVHASTTLTLGWRQAVSTVRGPNVAASRNGNNGAAWRTLE